MQVVLEELCKSYGTVRALNNVSATLDSGIYALLGPNGSGKSTLMNIITQNLKADSGRVLVDGRESTAMGAEFRALLGFMPQYPGLYPTFTVGELLAYVATLKKVPKAVAQEQIRALLAATEMEEFANRRVGALSGGMKQRLCLAQAMLGDPKLLILDEPTAGMDPKQRVNMRNYIARMAMDKTVLIATHLVEDVEFTAHRILMLKKGELISCASPADTVRQAEEHVWQLCCRAEELAAVQSRCRVIQMAQQEDELTLRVLADERPAADAQPLPPTLEDCYLYVFRDVIQAQKEE